MPAASFDAAFPYEPHPTLQKPPRRKALLREDLALRILEGWVGQWHFGKHRPGGADHEEQQPGLGLPWKS
jgi:hypothetical protein